MTTRIDIVPANAEHFPAENFLNRELGLLAFNRRVLAQARNPRTPLLERLRFLCIVSSELMKWETDFGKRKRSFSFQRKLLRRG